MRCESQKSYFTWRGREKEDVNGRSSVLSLPLDGLTPACLIRTGQTAAMSKSGSVSRLKELDKWYGNSVTALLKKIKRTSRCLFCFFTDINTRTFKFRLTGHKPISAVLNSPTVTTLLLSPW